MSKIDDRICQKVQARAKTGLTKYGVTLERNETSTINWLKDLQEKLLDGAGYIERILMDIESSLTSFDKISTEEHLKNEL